MGDMMKISYHDSHYYDIWYVSWYMVLWTISQQNSSVTLKTNKKELFNVVYDEQKYIYLQSPTGMLMFVV